MIGRSVPGLDHQCLRINDVQAGYDATRYLIDLGHRRVAHITGALAHEDARDRYKGYVNALNDAGLPIDPQLIVEGDFTEQSGLMAVQALLGRSPRFTAIFVATDQMAYGIRVPEDISLIGFDDQLGSAYTTPPLTTVRQPIADMGRAAAQGLLQMLAGQPLTLPTFEAKLVIREAAVMLRI